MSIALKRQNIIRTTSSLKLPNGQILPAHSRGVVIHQDAATKAWKVTLEDSALGKRMQGQQVYIPENLLERAPRGRAPIGKETVSKTKAEPKKAQASEEKGFRLSSKRKLVFRLANGSRLIIVPKGFHLPAGYSTENEPRTVKTRKAVSAPDAAATPVAVAVEASA